MVKFPAFIWVTGYLSSDSPITTTWSIMDKPEVSHGWSSLAPPRRLWGSKSHEWDSHPRSHYPTAASLAYPHLYFTLAPIALGTLQDHVTSPHLIGCLSEQNSDDQLPKHWVSFHVDLPTRESISGIWIRHLWIITYAMRKTSTQRTLLGGCRNSGQWWKPGKTGFCATAFSKTQKD